MNYFFFSHNIRFSEELLPNKPGIGRAEKQVNPRFSPNYATPLATSRSNLPTKKGSFDDLGHFDQTVGWNLYILHPTSLHQVYQEIISRAETYVTYHSFAAFTSYRKKAIHQYMFNWYWKLIF